MKILVLVTCLGLVAFVAACSPAATSPSPIGSGPAATSPPANSPAGEAVACLPDPATDGQQVAVVDFNFQPSEITVSAGDTVTWTNTGQAPHTATLDEGPTCDDERMSPGGRHSVQFDVAGEYSYHCAIHATMQGKVIVQP